jgi:hypothetical protein
MLRVLSDSIAGASIIGIDTSLLVLLMDGSSDSYGLLSGNTLIALAPEGKVDLVEKSHGWILSQGRRGDEIKLKLGEDKEGKRGKLRSWWTGEKTDGYNEEGGK